MLYFKMVRTPKYVHTSGTLYAHIRHTPGTLILIKIMHVPDVCHMCADTWGAYERQKIEKYRQFPFECWVARQKRKYLAPCGSI